MSNGRSFTTSFLTKYNNAAVSEFKKQLGELKKEMSDNKREQKELSKEIRDAQKEMKLINAEIKRTGQATDEQKKRLDELTNSINTDKEALEKLKLQQAQIQGKINDTNAAIEQQNKAFAEMKDSINNAKSAAGDFVKTLAGVTAAATAAVSGLFAFTSQAAQWADEVNTLSKTTGISTNELQKFMYATDLIDVSVETLSGALTKLTRNMAEPSKAASEAFDTLKVSTTDATGALRDRQEVFYETIEALGRVANETERDALAMDIFGRSAQELNPLIKGGAQVLKELGDEAERAGLILSQETLDGLNDFNDKLDLLKAKGTAIKNLAASEMTPAFDGLLEVADELLDDINEMAKSGELKKLAKELGEGIKNAANALKSIIKFVWEYKDAIGAAVAAMVTFKISMSIANLVNSLVTGFKALSAATKAETADMAALNTVMAANPIGVVISLVASLAVGLGSLAGSFASASGAANDYTRELRELQATEEKTMAKAAGEAALLREQYSEMKTLGSQTELTATQKERLASLEQTIADRLGITTQELKDQTGAYRDLTKEIDEYIDRLIEKAKYTHYENIITKAVELQTEIYDKLKKRYGELTDAYLKMSEEELSQFEIDREAINVYHEYTSVIERAKNAIYELGEGSRKTGKQSSELSGVVSDLAEIMKQSSQATAEAVNQTADLANEQKELQNQSSSLRSEMSSLASTMQSLEEGQALSLDTVLQLCDKYPEYAGELLNARDNAELQKTALEHLFEAKKAEYILTQQSAIDNIEASNKETETIIENSKKQMKARAMAVGGKWDKDIDDFIERRFANEFEQIKKNNEEIEGYRQKIAAIQNIKYSDIATVSRNSGSNTTKSDTSNKSGNGSGSDTTAAPFYETSARGVYASGSSYIGMYTQWLDRTKSLGMMTVEEEEKLLAELLKREENTAEERYQLKQRLYKARETLAKDAAAKEKEAADKAAEAEKEAEKKREEAAEKRRKKQEERDKQILDKQNLMVAAYKRLVENRIDALNAEAQAAEDAANREIAAIDKKIEKRKQEESIDKKQQELAKINAKLRYGKLTDFERYELEKRRQEINNDISAEYRDREYENQKERLRSGAEAVRSRNDTAIAGLRASETQLSDHVAALQGNQTYDQRVKNNSTAVNVNIVNQGLNGLSIDQLVVKTVREVVKALGGT